MKNYSKPIMTVVLALTVLFGLTFMVSAAPDEKPKSGGTIVQGTRAEPSSVDAHFSRGGNTRMHIGQYIGYLLYTDEKGNIKPGLAKTWEMPDSTTLILKLREDVTFHDGTPFDAEAVIYNFDRILGKTGLKSPGVGQRYVAGYKSYEAVDKYTVKIVTKAIDPALLEEMYSYYMGMVSPTAAKKYGEEFNLHAVSCGPYVLKEYTPGSHKIYEKFDKYWKKDKMGNTMGYADKIKVMTIPDHATRAAALRSGTIDIDQFPEIKQALMMKDAKNITVKTIKGLNARYMTINTGKAPLDNVWARRAINYAVDRREIIMSAARGEGMVPNGFFGPISWAYDPALKWYEYDVAKAKEALKKAGLPDGFKFKAAGFNPASKPEAEMIQAQLKRVGIDMQVEFMDMASYGSQFRKQGLYHAGFGSYPMVGFDPSAIMMVFHHSKGPFNEPTRPTDYDKLIEESGSMMDRAERKKAFAKIHQKLYDLSPDVYYIWTNDYRAYRNHLKGYQMNADQFSCLEEVWIDK